MKKYANSGEASHDGVVYIILAFFLGWLGLHNFYAGYWKRGLTQFVISLTSPYMMFIPLLFTAIWAGVEIFFVNKSADGKTFGGNSMAIWILRGLSAVILVWVVQNAGVVLRDWDLQMLADI